MLVVQIGRQGLHEYLTFRNRKPVTSPIRRNEAAAILGKAYGNLFKKVLFPKRLGCLAAGLARAPPRPGPKILPIVKTKGIKLNALACSSFSGIISATTVLKVPTFPFVPPAMALATIAHGKFCEKPNRRQLIKAENTARRMVGFRPHRSAARPHKNPVQAWEREKVAVTMPAHFATSFLGTLKLSIISGYGI